MTGMVGGKNTIQEYIVEYSSVLSAFSVPQETAPLALGSDPWPGMFCCYLSLGLVCQTVMGIESAEEVLS